MNLNHNNNIQHYQVVFDQAGIGDCVARLVPVLYTAKYYKPIIMHLFVPDYFVDFAKRCIDKRYTVRGFSNFQKHIKKTYPFRTFGANQFNNLSCSMVQHAYAILLNTIVNDPKDLNYPLAYLDDVKIDKFNLPKKYAVFAVGFTSPVREWRPEHINRTLEYVKSKGFEVVFLGAHQAPNGMGHIIQPVFKEEIKFEEGINLLDKTTIVEAAKIMKESSFVVGLDSGLLHVAAASREDLPIICGYTTVRPEHRAPYRKNQFTYRWYSTHVPETMHPCVFSQSKYLFLFNFDFKQHHPSCKNDDCLRLLDHTYYIKEIDRAIEECKLG